MLGCLFAYIPFLCLLLAGSWYLKKIIPSYVDDYLNVSDAQKLAYLSQTRVEFLKETLSFPLGLPSYMGAWSANIAAASKAATLEMAATTTTTLLIGLLHITVILLILYSGLCIIKQYKRKTRDEMLINQIMNKRTPRLEEINENVNDIKKSGNFNNSYKNDYPLS